jgi:hypothetical protein
MFFISWIPNLSDSPELNDLMNQGVDLLQIDTVEAILKGQIYTF